MCDGNLEATVPPFVRIDGWRYHGYGLVGFGASAPGPIREGGAHTFKELTAYFENDITVSCIPTPLSNYHSNNTCSNSIQVGEDTYSIELIKRGNWGD